MLSRAEFVSKANLPTEFGSFVVYGFRDVLDNKEHVAIVKGDTTSKSNVTTRIHSECLTGDAFGSLRCDCRSQLILSLKTIEKEGCGIVLYLRQEGRGIGLLNKLRAYSLQDSGVDTLEANLQLGLPADARSYQVAADMLKYLQVQSVNLLTNNPKKVHALEQGGIQVDGRTAHAAEANRYNLGYLRTKNEKMGHLIPEQLLRYARTNPNAQI